MMEPSNVAASTCRRSIRGMADYIPVRTKGRNKNMKDMKNIMCAAHGPSLGIIIVADAGDAFV
jgi:hypothetical protein